MYKLLRTVCNASSLEMNSENKKKTKDMGDHTGCCCAEFSNSIHRILGFGATTTQKQEARREDRPREPGATEPGEEVGRIPQRNSRT